MDLRKVKKLIELLEDSALVEMEISEGDSTIRLSRAGTQHGFAPPINQVTPSVAHTVAAAPVGQPELPGSSADTVAVAGKVIESPMVGTFYNSPSPDVEPYVVVGSTVNVGDTLCLIEAMKTFNQLEAEVAGTITAIHKKNGEPVEYGEPLFVIE